MESKILLKYAEILQMPVTFSFFRGLLYCKKLRFEVRKASIDEEFVSKLQADTANIQEMAL